MASSSICRRLVPHTAGFRKTPAVQVSVKETVPENELADRVRAEGTDRARIREDHAVSGLFGQYSADAGLEFRIDKNGMRGDIMVLVTRISKSIVPAQPSDTATCQFNWTTASRFRGKSGFRPLATARSSASS